jgi:hypothetical protein
MLEALWFLVTAIVTTLMFCAQVGPDQAVSNLGNWAVRCGLRNPPDWLKSPWIDRVVKVDGGIVLIVLAIAGWLFLGFPKLIIFSAAFVALAFWAQWTFFVEHKKRDLAQAKVSRSPKAADNQSPYLEKAFIHPDPLDGPTYFGIPLRKGYDARVFVEYQHYETTTHKWSQVRRILITEEESFSVGPFDAVKTPLLLRGQNSQWQWKSLNSSETESFDPQRFYRGRVTFVGSEGLSEDCWFKSRPGDLPLLEDNNSVFGFIPEWKARDERRGHVPSNDRPIFEAPKVAKICDFGSIKWTIEHLDPGENFGGTQKFFRLLVRPCVPSVALRSGSSMAEK